MARIPIPVGAWGNISVSGKRGNYRAAARFRLANGKTITRSRYGHTKEAARNALLEHLTELREQTIGGEVSGATTVRTFANDWFTRWEESNPPHSTIRTYRAALRWIKEELGMLRLTECTTGRLEKGIGRISEAHGQTTAKQARSVLRHVFADAVRLDAIAVNPALGVSTVKEQAQEVRAMTVKEVQAFRKAARDWEATPVTANKPVRREIADSIDVMLGTGVRIGELLAIRWEDVDLTSAVPMVSVMGTVTRGANGEGMVWQPAPKSETSKRTLYLPAFAAEALRRQFELREFRPQSLTVFPSESGTLRDPSNYRAHFRQVRRMAKLDWVTPKTIRKTVATTIYTSDGLDNASQQLGHSEIGVTAKHYVQRLNIGPAGVVGVLDEWMQSVS